MENPGNPRGGAASGGLSVCRTIGDDLSLSEEDAAGAGTCWTGMEMVLGPPEPPGHPGAVAEGVADEGVVEPDPPPPPPPPGLNIGLSLVWTPDVGSV